MKRRTFIKSGASALFAVPLILSRPGSVFAASEASPIVQIRDDEAFRMAFTAGKIPNEDNVIPDTILSTSMDYFRIARMMDAAVLKLTGKSTVGKAWESLFPEGFPRPDTKIVLKVNFSYSNGGRSATNNWFQNICPFAPKSPLINAIIAGLLQMNDGTFPVENITLFDSTYRPEKQIHKLVVQGFRPVKANGLGIFKESQRGSYNLHLANFLKKWEFPAGAPQFTAAPDFPEKYQAHQRINSTVYHDDFMINITHPKDHRAAGITGVLKNTYGCTDNPMGTHGWDWNAQDNPYPGTGICIPVFYKEINRQTPCILNVMDAFAGLYHGGPLSGRVFQANSITISRDPVALDSWELDMINRIRKQKGYSRITTQNAPSADGHPNASFLRNATEVHNLGNSSLQNVKEYNLSRDSSSYALPALERPVSFMDAITKTGKNYRVVLLLDRSKRKHTIRAEIKNIQGDTIRNFKTIVTGSEKTTLSWDHKNDEKVLMPPALYIWQITADGMVHSGTVNDFKN